MTDLADLSSLKALLNDVRIGLPQIEMSTPDQTRAWLALSPAWPEQLAVEGFPVESSELATGQQVSSLLRKLNDSGVLEAGAGEAPLRGMWYWMPSATRTATIEGFLADGRRDFLRTELVRIGKQLTRGRVLPPVLDRFAKLADAAGHDAMGLLLDSEVVAAIDSAERAGQFGCPEALRWIETADSLSVYFAADLEVAVARARRKHEVFLRRSRDAYFLQNYTPRPELETPFIELLDAGDKQWALHYLGEGGMGKTMLIRRINAHWTKERNLAVSRIDFDYVNPDYPARAPGLLLQILADDLRLIEYEDVQELLRKFTKTIEAVHKRLETRSRAGTSSTVSYSSDLLDEAEGLFIEVLRAIVKRRQNPLFILDTCEELTRLRPNGELPDAVIKTLELLNRLHNAVPSLRVVFSGRRPLPEHEFLRVVRVQGFDDGEADSLLETFVVEKRKVPRSLRAGIKQQSRIEENRPDDSADVQRYNPYDLDLYARWVTTMSASKRHADLAALLASGAHLYVRERIIQRAGRLPEWLPVLTLLGQFDRALLAELAGGETPSFARLFDEVTQQEWIDFGRGALRADEGEEDDENRIWVVERNIRARLERYYRQIEPDAWRSARQRLRDILADITRHRSWSQLTPGYFTVTFDLLADYPVALAEWWRDIDRKIVADGAWEWAEQLISALPVYASDEDEKRYPSACAALQGPLRAAVLATDASVSLQLGNTDQLQSKWIAVQSGLGEHPLTEDHGDLAYRAAAGVIAGGRYLSSPLAEPYIHELQGMLERVPPTPTSADGENAATELALIENCLEMIEQIDWRNDPPPSLLQILTTRLTLLLTFAPPELRPFVVIAQARLSRVMIEPAFSSRVITALEVCLKTAPIVRWFRDWVRPAAPGARLSLELCRLGRDAGPEAREQLRAALKFPTSFETLDDERAAAALLLLLGDRSLPDDPPHSLIGASISLDAAESGRCYAHRHVPPFFQVALIARAERGGVEAAVVQCLALSRNSGLALATRQAADRALLTITARWRLRDEGYGSETSIHQSKAVSDRLLIADADAVDPRHGAPAIDAILDDASPLDRPLILRRAARKSAVGDARLPASTLGRRFVARLMLSELVQLHRDDPTRTRSLLTNTANLFEEARDPVGVWHTWLVEALAAAGGTDRSRLQQAVTYMTQAASEAIKGDISADGQTKIPDFPISVTPLEESLLRRPLMRPIACRMISARIRLDEFEHPGAATRKMAEYWRQYAGAIPAECALLFPSGRDEAPPTPSPVEPASEAAADTAPVSSRTSVLKTLWIVLRGLIGGVVGLSVVSAGVLWLYRGYDRVFTGTVGDVSNKVEISVFVVLLVLALVALGNSDNVAIALRRLWLRMLRVEYYVFAYADDERTNPVLDTVRAQERLRLRALKLPGFFSGSGEFTLGRERWRTTYREWLPQVTEPIRIPRWSTPIGISGRRTPVDVELEIADAAAAEPWEALFTFRHTSGGEDEIPNFRFRRKTMASALRGRGRQEDHAVAWQGQARLLFDTRLLRGLSVDGELRANPFAQVVTTSLGQRLGPSPSADESVIAAIGVAEASYTESGLMLQFEDRMEVFPGDVIRAFPSLRLLVLVAPPRSEMVRLPGDALDAARFRVAAARLHASGIPAVLVVPPLDAATLGPAILNIAKAAGLRWAMPALRKTVQDLRDTIAAAPAVGDIDSRETSFDVCFYCVGDVSLKIKAGRTAPPMEKEAS